jgi:hypothetical protein
LIRGFLSLDPTETIKKLLDGQVCTDPNFLCYNSFTGQGQLLWVGVCLHQSFGRRFCLVSINLGIWFYGVETGDAVKMFLRGFPLFSSWPSARMVRGKTTVRSEVYGRFMGGSDRIRIIPGHLGRSVQHMQIAQGRINTGYFASC